MKLSMVMDGKWEVTRKERWKVRLRLFIYSNLGRQSYQMTRACIFDYHRDLMPYINMICGRNTTYEVIGLLIMSHLHGSQIYQSGSSFRSVPE